MNPIDRIPQQGRTTIDAIGVGGTLVSWFNEWSTVITGLVGLATLAWLAMQMYYKVKKEQREQAERDKLN